MPKYSVLLKVVVNVRVAEFEANSPEAAIAKSLERADLWRLFGNSNRRGDVKHTCYGDMLTYALVDLVGGVSDTEYHFKADGNGDLQRVVHQSDMTEERRVIAAAKAWAEAREALTAADKLLAKLAQTVTAPRAKDAAAQIAWMRQIRGLDLSPDFIDKLEKKAGDDNAS